MFRPAFFLLSVFILGVPSPLLALNVYLTSSEEASHDIALGQMLTDAGHSVTSGVPWYEVDSTQDLSGIDVLILQANYNWSVGEMPAAGQAALVAFVNQGGSLFTTAWLNYNIENDGDYATLKALLPVTNPEREYNIFPGAVTHSLISAHPTVRAGLPNSFTFTPQNIGGTESRLVAKPGATAYTVSNTRFDGGARGSGVVGWQYGKGRVVSFSTTCGESDFDSPLFRVLFLNMIEWTRQPRTRPSLSVKGGNSPKFKKPRATVRGTARDTSSGINSVTYRVGRKGSFRTAKGTADWRFSAKLRARRTPATIRATNGDGVVVSRNVRLTLRPTKKR
jgi:hypothetical protein